MFTQNHNATNQPSDTLPAISGAKIRAWLKISQLATARNIKYDAVPDYFIKSDKKRP